ncbi:MAG: NAD-binding protein, partial [Sporomusa sp.]
MNSENGFFGNGIGKNRIKWLVKGREYNMKIIIVGCGRNGAGLALALSKAGHAITVIDFNKSAFSKLGQDFKGKTIEGVGFDRDILT